MTVESVSFTPQCTVSVFKELPVSRGFPAVIMSEPLLMLRLEAQIWIL